MQREAVPVAGESLISPQMNGEFKSKDIATELKDCVDIYLFASIMHGISNARRDVGPEDGT